MSASSVPAAADLTTTLQQTAALARFDLPPAAGTAPADPAAYTAVERTQLDALPVMHEAWVVRVILEHPDAVHLTPEQWQYLEDRQRALQGQLAALEAGGATLYTGDPYTWSTQHARAVAGPDSVWAEAADGHRPAHRGMGHAALQEEGARFWSERLFTDERSGANPWHAHPLVVSQDPAANAPGTFPAIAQTVAAAGRAAVGAETARAQAEGLDRINAAAETIGQATGTSAVRVLEQMETGGFPPAWAAIDGVDAAGLQADWAQWGPEAQYFLPAWASHADRTTTILQREVGAHLTEAYAQQATNANLTQFHRDPVTGELGEPLPHATTPAVQSYLAPFRQQGQDLINGTLRTQGAAQIAADHAYGYYVDARGVKHYRDPDTGAYADPAINEIVAAAQGLIAANEAFAGWKPSHLAALEAELRTRYPGATDAGVATALRAELTAQGFPSDQVEAQVAEAQTALAPAPATQTGAADMVQGMFQLAAGLEAEALRNVNRATPAELLALTGKLVDGVAADMGAEAHAVPDATPAARTASLFEELAALQARDLLDPAAADTFVQYVLALQTGNERAAAALWAEVTDRIEHPDARAQLEPHLDLPQDLGLLRDMRGLQTMGETLVASNERGADVVDILLDLTRVKGIVDELVAAGALKPELAWPADAAPAALAAGLADAYGLGVVQADPVTGDLVWAGAGGGALPPHMQTALGHLDAYLYGAPGGGGGLYALLQTGMADAVLAGSGLSPAQIAEVKALLHPANAAQRAHLHQLASPGGPLPHNLEAVFAEARAPLAGDLWAAPAALGPDPFDTRPQEFLVARTSADRLGAGGPLDNGLDLAAWRDQTQLFRILHQNDYPPEVRGLLRTFADLSGRDGLSLLEIAERDEAGRRLWNLLKPEDAVFLESHPGIFKEFNAVAGGDTALGAFVDWNAAARGLLPEQLQLFHALPQIQEFYAALGVDMPGDVATLLADAGLAFPGPDGTFVFGPGTLLVEAGGPGAGQAKLIAEWQDVVTFLQNDVRWRRLLDGSRTAEELVAEHGLSPAEAEALVAQAARLPGAATLQASMAETQDFFLGGVPPRAVEGLRIFDLTGDIEKAVDAAVLPQELVAQGALAALAGHFLTDQYADTLFRDIADVQARGHPLLAELNLLGPNPGESEEEYRKRLAAFVQTQDFWDFLISKGLTQPGLYSPHEVPDHIVTLGLTFLQNPGWIVLMQERDRVRQLLADGHISQATHDQWQATLDAHQHQLVDDGTFRVDLLAGRMNDVSFLTKVGNQLLADARGGQEAAWLVTPEAAAALGEVLGDDAAAFLEALQGALFVAANENRELYANQFVTAELLQRALDILLAERTGPGSDPDSFWNKNAVVMFLQQNAALLLTLLGLNSAFLLWDEEIGFYLGIARTPVATGLTVLRETDSLDPEQPHNPGCIMVNEFCLRGRPEGPTPLAAQFQTFGDVVDLAVELSLDPEAVDEILLAQVENSPPRSGDQAGLAYVPLVQAAAADPTATATAIPAAQGARPPRVTVVYPPPPGRVTTLDAATLTCSDVPGGADLPGRQGNLDAAYPVYTDAGLAAFPDTATVAEADALPSETALKALLNADGCVDNAERTYGAGPHLPLVRPDADAPDPTVDEAAVARLCLEVQGCRTLEPGYALASFPVYYWALNIASKTVTNDQGTDDPGDDATQTLYWGSCERTELTATPEYAITELELTNEEWITRSVGRSLKRARPYRTAYCLGLEAGQGDAWTAVWNAEDPGEWAHTLRSSWTKPDDYAYGGPGTACSTWRTRGTPTGSPGTSTTPTPPWWTGPPGCAIMGPGPAPAGPSVGYGAFAMSVPDSAPAVVPAHVVFPDPGYLPADPPVPLRSLSHYLEGYPYSPQHAYTETFTTDPCYVREHVDHMSPGNLHSNHLTHLVAALWALIAWRDWHASREAPLLRIPAARMAAVPHTGAVEPDLAIWPFPAAQAPAVSYDFRRHGVPRLILEVVSHSSSAVRANDWENKFAHYRRMGVPEYWLLDTEAPEGPPLQGFRLTRDGAPYAPPPPVAGVYAPVPADAVYTRLPAVDDGWRSAVLGAALRWDEESATLQRRDDKRGMWTDVYVSPEVAAARGEARGEARGRHTLAVEQLVRMVRRHGALTDAQLTAYREELEGRTRLPDFGTTQERLLGFPPADRAKVVASFVATGYMPSPTDNGGTW